MEQVRKTGAESKKQVRSMKTRFYYTDYVNHMIRFFLTTPDTLQMEGKRKSDIENWLAVQDVWHKLGTDDRIIIEAIYKLHHWVPTGVQLYCQRTGADENKIWSLVIKTCSAIAHRRGLV